MYLVNLTQCRGYIYTRACRMCQLFWCPAECASTEPVVVALERGMATRGSCLFFAAGIIVLVKCSLRLRKPVVLLPPSRGKNKCRCRGQ